MTSSTAGPTPGAVRIFSIVNGLTLLGVLLQAVFAGEFIDQFGPSPWIKVHEICGYVVVLLAVITAVAAIALRRASSALTIGALSQLMLIAVQTGLGEAISKAGSNELIAIHVPLAMLIFGLGIFLSSAGAQLRRAAT